MQNSIQELEFNKIKSLIEQNCSSPLGREVTRKLAPEKNTAKIKERQTLIYETKEFLSSVHTLQLTDLEDTRELIGNPQKHQVLQRESLHLVANNAYLSQKLKKIPQTQEENWPHLFALINKLKATPKLVHRFIKTFDPEGEIKEDATAELKKTIQSQHTTKSRISTSLQKILDKKQYAEVVSERIITKREGRFVIPVKTEKKNVIKGVEHGRSQTGRSIYLEPLSVLELNNRLDFLKDSKKKEILKILTELTALIKKNKVALQHNLDILQKLDFINAAALYFKDLPATIPTLTDNFSLKFSQASHPLLYNTLGKDNIIPFSLTLGQDFRVLIISGVNTGGKTVTLKAVGLLTIMARSGLLVTAKKAEVGPFQSFYTDINDEQSLEDAISTFSSHVKKINNVLHQANEKSLILIDELGTGTNPEEGSALAQAILETLISLKSKVIITTHLNKLKVFASEHGGCQNGCMRFDEDRLKPTYKLDIGFPGNSFALDIAREYKIPENILNRAHDLLDAKTLKLSYLLKKTEQQRNRLAQKIYKYDLKQQLLADKITSLEKKEEDWTKIEKQKRKQMLAEEQEEFAHLKLKLDKELKKIQSISKKNVRTTPQKLKKLRSEIESQQKEITSKKDKILEEELESIDNPGKNDIVYIKSMDTIGKIDKLNSQQVVVKSDGLIFSIKMNDIYQVPPGKTKRSKTDSDDNVSITADFEREIPFEINVMGLTYSEAEPVIEKYIDRAVVMDYTRIRILHGKGTGRLRRQIRDKLDNDTRVAEFSYAPNSEGGSGVTILKLK